MDSIGFLILLIIYWVFTALAKAARDRKKKAGGQAPARPGQPGQRQQPSQSAPAGNEIPEFLRELLGLDDPRQQGPRRDRPSTGEEELEIDMEEPPQEVEVAESWESRHLEWQAKEAPVASDLAAHQRRIEEQIERAEKISAKIKKKSPYLFKSPILGHVPESAKRKPHRFFKTNRDLRRAIVMKEVLEQPVSKRQRRHPYWGNI